MSVKDVLLKRRGKIEVKPLKTEEENKNTAYVAAINANIQSLGYSLSEELFKTLESEDVEYLVEFNSWLVSRLKESVGADVEYSPMYPNFPKQVMEMEDIELYMNALQHYWNRDLHHLELDGFIFEPEYKKEERFPLPKDGETKTLELGGAEDKFDILKNLLSSSVAFSSQDKEDIRAFMLEEKWKKHLPEKFKNKENLAYLMVQALDSSRYLQDDFESLPQKEQELQKRRAINKAIKDAYSLKPYFRNATDVLRVYAGLSNGDISLSEKIKYRSLPRKERRFLLSMFEDVEDLCGAMSERPEEFKKAFELLHVDSQRGQKGQLLYPKTSKAINNIRDGELERSLLSRVQEAIDNDNIGQATQMLAENPGMLARKLDEILRLASKKENVLSVFNSIADKVDPKILLTLREHFRARTEHKDYRVFFPKGQVSKAFVKENDLEPISEELSRRVVSICDRALIDLYKDKGDLGKVYISDSIKGFKAPLVLRNLEEGSKTIVRGSRIPTDTNMDTLRAFIWWKDDVDNDLSAILFDENWNPQSHISYTNLKNKYGCHSGDITYQRNNGHDGECEFIDININKAKDAGVRYIGFQVHNFSRIPFDKANCKFGFMEREEPFEFSRGGNEIYPNTGEIFEPLTVEHVMDVTAPSTSMMPFIFDTETREVIWSDMAISGNFRLNNVESSLSSAQAACYACVNSEIPNLYDVLMLNAQARGEITENKEEADEVFDLEDGITPYDTDIIVSRFLSGDVDEQSKGYKKQKQIEAEYEQFKAEIEQWKKQREECKAKLTDLDSKLQVAMELLKGYESQLPEIKEGSSR